MHGKVENLENVLKQASSPKEEMDALLALSDYHTDHELVDGWNYGKRALRVAETLNDRDKISRANELIAMSLRKLTEYPEALTHFELALDSYLSSGDLYGVARCYCGMGIVCGSMEEYRTSLEYFEESLSACRRAKKDNLAATVVGNIGHCHFQLGRYKDAEQCFQHAISYYNDKNSDVPQANMIGGLAGVYVHTGEFDKGLASLEQAKQLYTKVDDEHGLSVAMMNEGLTYQKMGNLVRAKGALIQALAFARSVQFTMTELDCLKYLAEVCTQLNQEEEAQKYLAEYLNSENEERIAEANLKAEQIKKRQFLRSSTQ